MVINFHNWVCVERILNKLGNRPSLPPMLDKRHDGQGFTHLVLEECGSVFNMADGSF